MTTLMAHRHCRSRIYPCPPRSVVKQMQAELLDKMRALGDVRPCSLGVGAWLLVPSIVGAAADYVVMMSVTVEQGDMIGSFGSWYEWQHPWWRWIESPLPLELQRAETLLG